MTDFMVLIRNIVLAAMLAWVGMEFAPNKAEPVPEEKHDASLTTLARG